MAKESSMQEITKVLQGELIYLPTPPQRKVKAAFWAVYNENPIMGVDKINLATVQQITGSAVVSKWWAKDGFKEWFLNKDETRQRLEYLFNLSLDTAEEILIDPEANTNAKVQMIKLLAELTNKMPQKWKQEKFLDENIQKMDKRQLEGFLKKHGALPDSVDKELDN
jgi:hypothetical protein